jgi:hypothetical protein
MSRDLGQPRSRGLPLAGCRLENNHSLARNSLAPTLPAPQIPCLCFPRSPAPLCCSSAELGEQGAERIESVGARCVRHWFGQQRQGVIRRIPAVAQPHRPLVAPDVVPPVSGGIGSERRPTLGAFGAEVSKRPVGRRVDALGTRQSGWSCEIRVARAGQHDAETAGCLRRPNRGLVAGAGSQVQRRRAAQRLPRRCTVGRKARQACRTRRQRRRSLRNQYGCERKEGDEGLF